MSSSKVRTPTEKIAVYPASFDPMTIAHVSITKRAARVFDKLYVAIAVNPAKKGAFSTEERFSLVEACIDHIEVAEPIIFPDGLTVDHARKLGAITMIRGARSVTDFLDEISLFGQNVHVQSAVGISPDDEAFIDTQTYYTLPGQDHVASSLVRGLMYMPGVHDRLARIRPTVPDPVYDAITTKLAANN